MVLQGVAILSLWALLLYIKLKKLKQYILHQEMRVKWS